MRSNEAFLALEDAGMTLAQPAPAEMVYRSTAPLEFRVVPPGYRDELEVAMEEPDSEQPEL